MKAETDEDHISNTNSVLHVPANVTEQEPIITLWNVNWSYYLADWENYIYHFN